jgi:hypothetical protein
MCIAGTVSQKLQTKTKSIMKRLGALIAVKSLSQKRERERAAQNVTKQSFV